MKASTKAHLSLLGTNILFAVNYTAIKQVVNGGLMKPFALNIVRMAVTAALLWILYFFQKKKTPVKQKDYGRFFLCALTGIVINQLFFVKGLSYTFSIHASLLMLTTPILITIIAAWVLKESLTWFKIVGLILGICGAAVLIFGRETTGSGSNVLLGDVLIILNAIAYTIYFILVKPLMSAYDPVTVLRIIFTLGFFMALPFCYQEYAQVNWIIFSLRDIALIASVVIGGTFLAYLLNIYGIQILGASIAGAYIYSQVIFTAVIAMIFLHEELSFYKVIAGALIATGVYLSNKNKAYGNPPRNS